MGYSLIPREARQALGSKQAVSVRQAQPTPATVYCVLKAALGKLTQPAARDSTHTHTELEKKTLVWCACDDVMCEKEKEGGREVHEGKNKNGDNLFP